MILSVIVKKKEALTSGGNEISVRYKYLVLFIVLNFYFLIRKTAVMFE